MIALAPSRGLRNQICVTDVDGDGKLELLVGDDFGVRRLPDAADKEQRARLAEIDEQLASADAEERKALLREKNDLCASEGTHSYVWLYRRR